MIGGGFRFYIVYILRHNIPVLFLGKIVSLLYLKQIMITLFAHALFTSDHLTCYVTYVNVSIIVPLILYICVFLRSDRYFTTLILHLQIYQFN